MHVLACTCYCNMQDELRTAADFEFPSAIANIKFWKSRAARCKLLRLLDKTIDVYCMHYICACTRYGLTIVTAVKRPRVRT